MNWTMIFELSSVSVLLLLVLECVLYLLKFAPYYRWGPSLIRERWQTTVSVEEIRRALDVARQYEKLSSRLVGNMLMLRPRWWVFSSYPRFTLMIEEDPTGSVLHYEVRPFLSGMLVILVGTLSVPLRYYPELILGIVIISIGIYAFVAYELRKWRRFGKLRRHLRSVGLLICDRCGYDLHGHEPGGICPECGTVIPID